MASSIPLYNMPPEIWLNILTHLSEPDFLALKRSSPYLRQLITQNASTICNNLIMIRYAQEASIIGSTLLDGWLVPTHPAIAREEKHQLLQRSISCSLPRSRDRTPPVEETKPKPVIRTLLSAPGPQYLRFLTEYSFEIRIANSMFMVVDDPTDDNGGSVDMKYLQNKGPRPEKFDAWIALYTIRRFLNRLQRVAGAKIEPGCSNCYPWGQDCAVETEKGLAWFYA